MIWSKTKKVMESLLADSVKKRVQYHVTRYGPGVSQIMTRAWVTWDGDEIANMSTIEGLQQVKEKPEGEDLATLPGMLSRYAFLSAAEVYLDSSIEQSLASDDPIVRAFAMLDRRVGKRRLAKLDVENKHPLVRKFYALRCEAEDLPKPDDAQ